MRKIFLIITALVFVQAQSQATYTASNYASAGDLFYNTAANELTLDYETTGANFNWNFSNLTGTSQIQIQFRSPISTGFLWPFIFNSNNTNLSSTTNQTPVLNLPGQVVGIDAANDYFKKSTADLRQVGSAYKIDYNGTQLPITNQYADADIIYRFPIQFGNTDNDDSSYTIDIPTLLHQENTLQRTNEVDGWGSLVTPYGTYNNVLRMKTILVSNDSIALLGAGLPRTITTTRELKWLDPSQKQPVMVVKQNNDTGTWVTTNVTYLDQQRDFATTAFFTHAPANPAAGEEVYFQNLSTNATTYSWDFGDPSSGASNTSSEEYPTHTFAADGVYTVQLTASNASFTDTYSFIIIIGNLAVAQNNTIDDLAVYPNPFSNQLRLNPDLGQADYCLSDMKGQKIYQGKNIQQEDFSCLESGTYLLTIRKEKQIKTLKVVKQ